MTSSVKRRLVAACLVAGATVLAPAVAGAHDVLASADGGTPAGYAERHLGQHGGTAGHLPSRTR